ncbi:hypothetical protein VNI00_013603 [Paramarasmius palmivorus]|uniref:Uncharacterized protein n=1 Tax=Paramarasmius palmivorus TaxID=297713 RepID=A0AAW0C0G7_9AGAR
MRYGRLETKDVETLKLTVTCPECPPTDFSSGEWTKAALVTPRHGVRRVWNEAVLYKHYEETKQRIFTCPAEDIIKSHSLSLPERYGLALRSSNRTSSGRKRNTKQDL